MTGNVQPLSAEGTLTTHLGWRDHVDIQHLLARYCYAIDGRDSAAFRELWAEDACYDVGGAFGAYRGADEIVRGAEDIWNAFVESHHWTSNIVVNSSGPDRATATSNVLGHLVDPENNFVLCAADYADEFCRTDGAWLFRERKITIHYLRQVEGNTYG